MWKNPTLYLSAGSFTDIIFKFRPYERGSWAEISHSGNIVSVNAFYSPNSNTMIVPIGMLQDPLYWSQPKSLTFGAFGIVVGKTI